MKAQILLGLIGLSAGMAAAAGVFALITALGLLARFAGKTHTGKYVKLYETAVILGASAGNLISIYQLRIPAGRMGLALFGASAGIFTGAWIMALTEIVEVIPIASRRLDLRRGLAWVISSMAAGRTLGALLYYLQRW